MRYVNITIIFLLVVQIIFFGINLDKNNMNNIIYNNITYINNNSDNQIDFYLRKIRFCSENATLENSTGLSMFPYSWEGGYYWMDPVEFKDLEIGDVITYSRVNKSNIHHAICNLYDDRLYTCGYKNNFLDEVVYPEQIIGRDCFKR